ncbi:MAG: PAS domain S-box protein [Theionarchaea archaeon]|nr:PAS domain S-box protein [Theionarchaea archaeon]
MTKHTTMSIPKALYDSVKEIIDSVPELGYTTPAEFCKDAIRRRISDIKKECQISKHNVEYIISEVKKSMNSHEKYKSIFDSVNCAIAVFSNPDGMLIAFNRRFLEILGYSESDVESKSFYDFVIPEDVPRVKRNFRARIKGEDMEDTCVMRALGGNGAVISIGANCSLYKVGEHVKGVSVLIRKIDKE